MPAGGHGPREPTFCVIYVIYVAGDAAHCSIPLSRECEFLPGLIAALLSQEWNSLKRKRKKKKENTRAGRLED